MIDQQSIKVPFWPSGAMLYIPGAGSLHLYTRIKWVFYTRNKVLINCCMYQDFFTAIAYLLRAM